LNDAPPGLFWVLFGFVETLAGLFAGRVVDNFDGTVFSFSFDFFF